MTEPTTKSDAPLCSSFDSRIKEIIGGVAVLPNAEPIQGDVGAAILHYQHMLCGTVLLPNGSKKWGARIFLDYGQGGQFYGSGIVAWSEWKDGAYRATGMKFAICRHTPVEGAGAHHSRGWHPARCLKCGLDMSVDSGD